MNTFKIKVPDFEGPLDLLLFFIRRDELDIYDIPISHITKEFLEYMHMLQMLDLELAGEFIVMASMLMQIKARMLLPVEPIDEGEDLIDPRAELTRRLLEYKKFKESAEELQNMEFDQRKRFFRRYFREDVRTRDPALEEQALADVTLFHLIKAFRNALMNIPAPGIHEVHEFPYTIDEQATFLVGFFGGRPEYNFLEIVRHMQEKIQVVVTFIALLELVRARRIRIEMEADFNNFRIIRITKE